MRIDLFNHFIPPAYLEALQRRAPAHPLVRLSAGLRPLWDMEERLRMLAPWPDLQQVVVLGQPTPELVAGPEESPALARTANDGMAAIRDAHPQRLPDLRTEQRWPAFCAATVAATPVRSVLAFPIEEQPERAALNLYAGAPRAFDGDARVTAGLFGIQAAMLLYGSQHAANLRHAVDSRDIIGQAKGILMERFSVDDDAAFAMLARSSQDTNLKLVEVARWLHDEVVQRSHANEAG